MFHFLQQDAVKAGSSLLPDSLGVAHLDLFLAVVALYLLAPSDFDPFAVVAQARFKIFVTQNWE
jgi:hypothetical protein